MKRKNENSIDMGASLTKRIKFNPGNPKIDNTWLSPSALRLCLVDNHLVDYLNSYPKQHNFTKINQNTNSSSTPASSGSSGSFGLLPVLFEKGNKFEENVKNYLESNFGSDFINIDGNFRNVKNEEFFNKTKNAIHNKIPIIYQGVLYDYDRKLFGIPDLLVREDYLEKIFTDFEHFTLTSESYYVIDIKFSTLYLTSNGINILNKSPNVKFYKSQLLIYNQMLNKIQKFRTHQAYILGRRVKYESKGEKFVFNSCFAKPGTVDFDEVDSLYKEHLTNAITIKRDIMENGETFELFPPSRSYLYPNMCLDPGLDNGWTNVKKEIAMKLQEITLIPNCRVTHRENAHQSSVYKWSDPLCNAELLGINGKRTSEIVDNILNSLRSGILITPQKIKNNHGEWKNIEPLELFIDFETANDLVGEDFNEFPQSKSMDIIYMIGMGWYDTQLKWNYKSFVINKLDYQEEKNIINDFNIFVSNLAREYNTIYNSHILPKLYHWGHIEESKFSASKERHNGRWKLDRWVDICNILKREPVTFNGVFNYKLKEVGKFLEENNLIKTKWNSSDTTSGSDSIITIKKCFDKANELNLPLSELDEMKDIIKYNETDCKVTSEILLYLRDKHT
jgi:predicted RecB family nuclease